MQGSNEAWRMKQIWVLIVAAMLFSGCRSMMGVGNGNSLAVVTVKKSSMEKVRAATLEVFREDGFAKASETAASMSFAKQGGRSAEIAWKTVGNSNPIIIRPTVRWSQAGGGEIRVSCNVEVTQASTVYGETVREPVLAGKGAYRSLLKEVKRRAEAGGG